MLIEMEVTGLTVDPGNNTPIVVLKEKEGERILPIWIGVVEASAIAFELEKLKLNRPMTHDLFKNAVESLGGHVERIRVVELKENTYYATVVIEQGDRTIEIDSRPSDAIAIALRAAAPIWCAQDVIDQAQSVELVTAESADEPTLSGDATVESSMTPPPKPPPTPDATQRRTPEPEGPRPIFGAERDDLGDLLESLEPEDFGKYKM